MMAKNDNVPDRLGCRIGLLLVFSLILSLSTSCSQQSSQTQSEDWPNKPIVISCFAAAGGGTDMVSRLVAETMEDQLGVNINVVNRPSGRGGAAINYVWSQPHDGSNWGGFSESVLPASVLGITERTAEDWHFYMVAGAPGVISVAPDSPYENVKGLVEAARKEPESVKVSAGLTGGIWHTKLVALQSAADVKFQFIPFEGSQPSQLAALSGEVDAVLTSISEQAELIRGNKLRPLAMVEMESFDFPEHGEIPAAGDPYPGIQDLPVQQFLGFALPRDTPQPIIDRIDRAFVEMMKSPKIESFCEDRLLSRIGVYGEEANQRAINAERAWTWKLHELGIAVRSPKEVGVPKPAQGETESAEAN